jgi:dipeptidyl aminopeptidase/acylaminoacyl peptidase
MERGTADQTKPESLQLNGASQQKLNQGGEAGINNITPLNTKYVTNYYFPYQLGGDSLLYLKSSYRKLAAFYVRDINGEHKLRTRDISIDQQFSYRNGKIVYAAYKPDARWGWKNFSVIRILNVNDGRQQTLTSRTKYFTPDISPDGNKIAAVQVRPGW